MNKKRKNSNFQFIGKFLYLKKEKILVIADLHLGYEQQLIESGVFIPTHQFEETIKHLKEIFSYLNKNKKKIDRIIILGDLKHEFSGILRQEWDEVSKLINYLKRRIRKAGKKAEIIVIKGNHDNYLMNISSRLGFKVKDFYITGENKNIAFVHGNKQFIEIFDKKIKTIVLGHLHPAVTLREGEKLERYKCFLVGKFKDKQIIILPSFFPLIEGSDILRSSLEDSKIAYNFNLNNFRVYAVANLEVLEFGKVKDIGRLN